MSFVNVFGGGVLQPSDISYRAIALAANTTLVWPKDSQSASDYVARVNDVTPSGAGLAITMPNANEVSTGMDILFRNLGANSFNVLDASGSVIVTVPAGTMQLIYLTDNTTTHGAWGVVAFGAGSAAINVASVAGLGLISTGPQLETAIQSQIVSAGNINIDATYRAQAVIWTGGATTVQLPQVASVGSNFWFVLRNQGTGVMTLAAAASEYMDGSATISLQPTESCIVLAGVTANWYSAGRGRSTSFDFTQLVKTVTGGSYSLTLAEAANVVQKWQGALTANQTVVLPAVVQVYYVQNATSGAYTLTFESPTPGTTISVPSGQNAVLFCDGTNVINCSTTVSGLTALLLGMGSVSAPSIAFSGDPSTGIYQPLTHTIGFAVAGSEVARITAAGLNGALGGTTPSTATITTLTMTQAINEAAPVVLASAGTVAIGAAASNNVTITGVTTITAFDTVAAGVVKRVKFTGVLLLTYNAASLVLPGAANITTQAGDEAVFRSLGAGNWECITYTRADGTSLAISLAILATDVHALTSKVTPAVADELPLLDSASGFVIVKLTIQNLLNSVWSSLGSLIAGGTTKTTPVGADALAIADSAAGNATKTLSFTNLVAYLNGAVTVTNATNATNLTGIGNAAAFDARYSPIAAMLAALHNQCTLSTPGASANMTVSAGSKIDSTGTAVITLASAMTKTTAAWVAGTGNGGLDTGAIAANTWYYFYSILNPTSGATDVTFSTNNAAPALPAGFTKFKYIGPGLTDASSHWYQFNQIGNNFYWLGDFADVSGALSTTPTNYTITVPRIANIVAKIKANAYNAGNTIAMRVYATTQSDVVLSTTTASANMQNTQTNAGAARINGTWDVPVTNSSAQVRAVCGEADTVSIYTYGWTDYNI